jgi:hypothetical protein
VNFLTLKSSKNSTIFVFNKLIIKYPLLKDFKKKEKGERKEKKDCLQERKILKVFYSDKELLSALFGGMLFERRALFYS